MAKKLKNVENEKCTLQDLKYGDRPEKLKNESRILEYWEHGDTHTVGLGKVVETLKNVKNEKGTLQDVEFCENTKKLGK